MNMQIKIRAVCMMSIFLLTNQAVLADTIINNSNSSGSAKSQPVQQCGGNQNNIYDPRVPPAGSYIIQNSDGSSNQLYTTGEKKPYYVDSNCNNTSTAPAQPYVFVPGGGRHR